MDSDLTLAVRTLECLCAWSLGIQTLEFLRLLPHQQSGGVWSWAIQRDDLAHSTTWVQRGFGFLYSQRIHRLHLQLRLLMAISLVVVGATIWNSSFLLLSTLLVLIRWRGAFNGGSDFMTLVVLSGIFLAQVIAPWLGSALAWKAGLWYITIHALSSYFLSGAVKLLYAGWRDGRALPVLLSGGLYGPLATDSLLRHRVIAIGCAWSFILWECAFPLALFDPRVTALWCVVGAGFHWMVFWYFGLNRFFWAWLCTYPALIYCATQLPRVLQSQT